MGHANTIYVNLALRKSRHNVTTPKDIRGIQKAERILVIHWWKTNTIEASDIPAPRRVVDLIPSNPEEFESSWLIVDHTVMADIDYVGVIDAKNLRVLKWMF
jgi:hypothetical protein